MVATAVTNGVPCPCLSTALSFYDGYRSEKVPANLIQVNFSCLKRVIEPLEILLSGLGGLGSAKIFFYGLPPVQAFRHLIVQV